MDPNAFAELLNTADDLGFISQYARFLSEQISAGNEWDRGNLRQMLTLVEKVRLKLMPDSSSSTPKPHA